MSGGFVFRLDQRWPGTAAGAAPARRLAQRLDRARLAQGLEALLRAHGAPIAYELFGRHLLLCAPALPGVAGDPDIALVLADAEHGLFMVAQRERGGLSFVSVHEAIHDAAVDLLSRAARGLRDPRGHVAPLVDILPE